MLRSLGSPSLEARQHHESTVAASRASIRPSLHPEQPTGSPDGVGFAIHCPKWGTATLANMKQAMDMPCLSGGTFTSFYALGMDIFCLHHRRALATGASRGIGAATAVALDRAGAQVAMSGRDETALNTVAASLLNDPVVLPFDLGESDAPSKLANAALEALGGIEILVNNAALAVRQSSEDLEAAQIDELLAVNVRGQKDPVGSVIPHRHRGRSAPTSFAPSAARPRM
jgi:hypothetical protein